MNGWLESFPWASALVLVPFVGGLLTLRLTDLRVRRHVGIAFASLVLALAAVLAAVLVASPLGRPLEDLGPVGPWGVRWHLGLDDLNAPFLPLAGAIVLLVLIAAPRRQLEGAMVPVVLLTEAATMGVYTSLDATTFALFWIACLVPGAFALREAIPGHGTGRALRAYGVFLGLGALPIVAAVVLLGAARAGAGAAHPFDLGPDAALASVPVSAQAPIFFLLAAALLVRKAVLPFHSWLPVLTERGPIAVTALLIGTHLGAFLASRMMLPLLPEASSQYLPYLADLALASALYGGLLGLAQHDLRRMLGFVLTSQMGLVMVGMGEANRESLHGALLEMLALGLTSTGLLLLVAQLEARAGTTDVRRLGGAAARWPFLAGSFFVLAIASVGFPGSLMFVSEDLLLHGLLGAHPIEATGLLLVTVLNGITLVHGFYRAFLGTPRRELGAHVPDLLPRERAVAVALVAVLLVTGLAPTPLLAARELVVRQLALAGDVHAPDVEATR
jgi:NADH-quinone oxidoreductase subunit M